MRNRPKSEPDDDAQTRKKNRHRKIGPLKPGVVRTIHTADGEYEIVGGRPGCDHVFMVYNKAERCTKCSAVKVGKK